MDSFRPACGKLLPVLGADFGLSHETCSLALSRLQGRHLCWIRRCSHNPSSPDSLFVPIIHNHLNLLQDCSAGQRFVVATWPSISLENDAEESPRELALAFRSLKFMLRPTTFLPRTQAERQPLSRCKARYSPVAISTLAKCWRCTGARWG
jgi:hypothetical protein